MKQAAKRAHILGALLVTLSAPALAVRTAVFPPEIRDIEHAPRDNRAAVWLDQGRVFNNEVPAETDRPIWIHGGDSLSSGWANRGTLRSKIARADQSEIPGPRSFQDIMESVPDPLSTWYAGTKINYGVLGILERAFSKPWVIISTALAGARLYPRPAQDPLSKENPLRFMAEVDHPERVRLITYSLGNNDICDGFDPTDAANQASLRADLRKLRERYPHAKIVPFEVVPVEQFYSRIQAALAQLPDTIGRQRVQEYCTQMWTNVCPQAMKAPQALAAVRTRLHQIFAEEGGHVYNPLMSVSGMNTLDLLSIDCFHPSGAAQRRIYEPLAQMILKELGQP